MWGVESKAQLKGKKGRDGRRNVYTTDYNRMFHFMCVNSDTGRNMFTIMDSA